MMILREKQLAVPISIGRKSVNMRPRIGNSPQMRKMFGKQLLEQCVGINAISFDHQP